MTEYRKYMFDDFVVEKSQVDISQAEITDEQILEENSSEETTPDISAEEEITAETHSLDETPEEELSVEEEEKDQAVLYSQEELDAAVKQAYDEAYHKGAEEVRESINASQVKLLEEINNQVTLIFEGIEQKKSEMEVDAIKVALNAIRKVFPTLEKEQAEAEIKNFLQENFANFSSQEMLSFAFHPDSVSLIASNLEKLAQQHDFEGKIAVHKDNSLGPSDCRVEWKSGGAERKASAILDKIESLTDNSEQERENG